MNLDILGLSGTMATGPMRVPGAPVAALTGEGGYFADIMASEMGAGQTGTGQTGVGQTGASVLALTAMMENFAVDHPTPVGKPALSGEGDFPLPAIAEPGHAIADDGEAGTTDKDDTDGLSDFSAATPSGAGGAIAMSPAMVPVAPVAAGAPVLSSQGDAAMGDGGAGVLPGLKTARDAATLRAPRATEAAGSATPPSLPVASAVAPAVASAVMPQPHGDEPVTDGAGTSGPAPALQTGVRVTNETAAIAAPSSTPVESPLVEEPARSPQGDASMAGKAAASGVPSGVGTASDSAATAGAAMPSSSVMSAAVPNASSPKALNEPAQPRQGAEMRASASGVQSAVRTANDSAATAGIAPPPSSAMSAPVAKGETVTLSSKAGDGRAAAADNRDVIATPAQTRDGDGTDMSSTATRPGEATSLLDIVKSLLPRRGREGSPVAAEAGQGSRPSATLPVEMRSVSAPAVLRDAATPPIASAAGASTGQNSPTGSPLAGASPAMANDGIPSSDGARVADASLIDKAGSPPAALPPRAVTEEAKDEAAAGETVERATGSTATGSSGSAPSSPPLFDLKTAGLSSSVSGSALPIALNGASVAAGLGQRVIDMGVSGQWIDDIARQIATIGDNPGRGSFQISSPGLGAVRVDITPGTQGSDIRLTAETEAAQIALMKDKGRLVHDAQIAAVRIGELRIDRMPSVSESQRGETGHEGQGHGGGSGQGAGQNMGQNAGQNGGQGGQSGARADMGGASSGQYSESNPKNPFTRSVISDAGAADTRKAPGEGKADTARYA
ncbi:MAG: hypothetical protein AB7E05_13370 [Sphingobium sp.]